MIKSGEFRSSVAPKLASLFFTIAYKSWNNEICTILWQQYLDLKVKRTPDLKFAFMKIIFKVHVIWFGDFIQNSGLISNWSVSSDIWHWQTMPFFQTWIKPVSSLNWTGQYWTLPPKTKQIAYLSFTLNLCYPLNLTYCQSKL